MLSLGLGLVVALLGSPQAQDIAVLPDIEVAAPGEDAVAVEERFVRGVSAPPARSGSLAVWTQPLCIHVDNLSATVAEPLQHRIESQARTLGLSIADSDCTPNIVIEATADGRATASGLTASHPRLFRPTPFETQLDKAALRHFVETDAPVRWWLVTAPTDIDSGQRLVSFGFDPAIIHRRGMTPPGGNARQTMQWAIVVLDASALTRIPLEALGDYLTLICLVQIDMTADDFPQESVLNLFRRTGVIGLTDHDRAFLEAIYASPPGWSHIRFNIRDVAQRMAARK